MMMQNILTLEFTGDNFSILFSKCFLNAFHWHGVSWWETMLIWTSETKKKAMQQIPPVCMSWSALLKVTRISAYWYLFYPCRSCSPLTFKVRKPAVWAVSMLIEDQLNKYLQSRNVGVTKQWNAWRTPMNVTVSWNIELHFILANLEKHIFNDLSCHSKWKQVPALSQT